MYNGSWQCYLSPYKRRSFSWHMYGFNGAAQAGLAHLWELYLADQGLTTRDCPVPGLFPEPRSSAAASGSSA